MSSFFSSITSSSLETNLSTARTIISTVAINAAVVVAAYAAGVVAFNATVDAASAMIARSRSFTDKLFRMGLRHYIYTRIKTTLYRLFPDLTMVIEEFEGLDNNQIYSAAEIYLGTIASPSKKKLCVSKSDHQETFTMERHQSVTDYFKGVKLNWTLFYRQVENLPNKHDITATLKSEIRSLELTFHEKHQDLVLSKYIPFILEEARSKKQELKALRIFTVDHQNLYGNLNDVWLGTTLDHPSTFDRLALDRDLREFIKGDLEKFLRRKEYYRKVGKVWKRGYLLYGPPGTGKSSLIAAMANYLHFDIYDLELTEVYSNYELRTLLIAMPNRSIVVVDDIDCTFEFQDRNSQSGGSCRNTGRSRDLQVRLYGLLNFIDGLWSTCGDERIIVFTTNHKEKLDPALLRPGRLDVHINMYSSYGVIATGL
ncbi:unnamed protein product [Lathyrus sativus]|nr:unnamed protein product [Lathyrus sativus]